MPRVRVKGDAQRTGCDGYQRNQLTWCSSADSVTPWTVACQDPLSMEFSRQESWSGLPYPPPGDLLNSVIEPRPLALQADFLLSVPPGKPKKLNSFWWWCIYVHFFSRYRLGIIIFFALELRTVVRYQLEMTSDRACLLLRYLFKIIYKICKIVEKIFLPRFPELKCLHFYLWW